MIEPATGLPPSEWQSSAGDGPVLTVRAVLRIPMAACSSLLVWMPYSTLGPAW